MQPWHRWREPLAVALLVALALMLVLRGIALGVALTSDGSNGFYGAIPGGDDLLLLAAAAAVLWCTLPLGDQGSAEETPAPSPHAWLIAVAGVVIVGLTVLGRCVLAVGNVVELISWPTPDLGFVLLVAEGLLRLAVPVAALAAVVLALRRAASARGASGGAPALSAPEPAVAAVEAPARLPAAWQADEATGAVWLTADDAAQGQPGLSWSDPTATAGAVATGPWAPAPPTPAEATEVPPALSAAPPPVAIEDDDLR